MQEITGKDRIGCLEQSFSKKGPVSYEVQVAGKVYVDQLRNRQGPILTPHNETPETSSQPTSNAEESIETQDQQCPTETRAPEPQRQSATAAEPERELPDVYGRERPEDT